MRKPAPRHRILILASALCLVAAAPAGAQIFAPAIEAFPTHPSAQGPFLLLLQDSWIDSCEGTVTTTVTPELIEITTLPERPPPGVACADVVLPFQRIIDLRALAPEVDFGASVTVRYEFVLGTPGGRSETLEVRFDEAAEGAGRVQSGGWVTPELGRSGLFVDQQAGIFSAMLADYDESGGGRWFYTAGPVQGAAYAGPMQSFQTIACVTAPCDRAAPARTGRVAIILRDRDDMLVQYDGVLADAAAERDAFIYERLRFERSPALADLDLRIPDLEGNWVAGVRAPADRTAHYGAYAIAFDRVDTGSGLPAYSYRAAPLGPVTDGSEPGFEIICRDERPVDGALACEVSGFETPVGSCFASFPFEAVGYERISTLASCDASTSSDATFDLFRLE